MTRKPDYRTRAGRESEVLAQIDIDGGLYADWLKANRQRPPALWRLMKSGQVRYVGMSWRHKERQIFRYEALEADPVQLGLRDTFRRVMDWATVRFAGTTYGVKG